MRDGLRWVLILSLSASLPMVAWGRQDPGSRPQTRPAPADGRPQTGGGQRPGGGGAQPGRPQPPRPQPGRPQPPRPQPGRPQPPQPQPGRPQPQPPRPQPDGRSRSLHGHSPDGRSRSLHGHSPDGRSRVEGGRRRVRVEVDRHSGDGRRRIVRRTISGRTTGRICDAIMRGISDISIARGGRSFTREDTFRSAISAT